MGIDSFISEFEELMWRWGVTIIDTGAQGDSCPRFINKEFPYTWDYPVTKYMKD
jgi:hypothetical protein